MYLKDWLFWNVDTQNDFVLPEGKLYVQGAELLKPKWELITKLAKDNFVRVVNSADFHYPDSPELSSSPDFIETFPPHCMANTSGAEFIPETNPENPVVFDWDKTDFEISEIEKQQNIVIRKDAFDVFKGNKQTDAILKYLSPKSVVVYGVTTNVCVNDAVVGLAERVEQVYVVADAIKELPNISLPFKNWEALKVKLIRLEDLEELIKAG
jgi:nicotinamidase/pyrazinamidase